MSPDFANYVELDFDTFLIWGEVDGRRFEVRLTGADARKFADMFDRHHVEQREAMLEIGRGKS